MSKIYLSPTTQQETQYTDKETNYGRKLWKSQRAIEGRLETAEFKLSPDQILLSVEASISGTIATKSYVDIQDDSIELASKQYTDGQLTSYATITLLNNQIATRVSTTDLNTTLTNYSTITQTADQIATRVANTDYNGTTIASLINQTSKSISLSALDIDLSGFVTFTNLSTSGQTTINGGNITTGTLDASKVTVTNLDASKITTGSLSASTITVGGWSVNATSIYKGNTKLDAANDRIYLNTNAWLYGYASGTIGVSGSMQFLDDNNIKLSSANGSLELKDGALTSLNASAGFKTLNLNGSKIMTAAHFSLAGTTLTITV